MNGSEIKRSDITGCELYSGRISHFPGERFYGHNGNWNLLLTEKGKISVSLAGRETLLESGALVLIEPGMPRLFTIHEEWHTQWIHFNMDAHISIMPEWPLVNPNIFKCFPDHTEFMKIARQFSEICDVCKVRRRGWYHLAYCMIQEIILRGNMIYEKGLDSKHIEQTMKMLEHLDSIDNMENLAKECSISRAGFFAKFKETFGITPCVYREQQIMIRVQELLSSTNMPLKEIAQKMGFSNSFYLSNRFKKKFGISPMQYRTQYLKTLSEDV